MPADGYAGWSGSFPPEVVAQRLSQSLPDLELPAEQVVAKWIPGFVTPSAPPSVIDELGAITSDFDPEGMRVMIQALAEADLRHGLSRISVPTLLIWGEEDKIVSVDTGRRLQRDIEGSRLIVYPRTGHVPQEEAREKFAGRAAYTVPSLF